MQANRNQVPVCLRSPHESLASSLNKVNMKKLIYTLLVTLSSLTAWSQSEPIFTFNLYNQLNFNPAYAGSKEVLDAGLIYRNQWWSGIEGAPRNVNLWGHMPFAKRRSGIGLNVLSDKVGIDQIITLGADYAYRIHFSGRNVLAIGLGVRFENARTDWADVNGAVDPGDNLIGNDAQSKATFNVGPGIYFKNQTFYLGVSIPRVLANSLYEERDEFSGSVNTYFIQGGLSLPVAPSIELLPNVQVRYNPNTPYDMDLNLNVLFSDKLMLGVMYRWEDSVDGLVAYSFSNGLRLGVALDFTTSELKTATTGSFELMLGYTFPCEDCKIQNLRYF